MLRLAFATLSLFTTLSCVAGAERDELLRGAEAAERAFDAPRALERYLAAEKAGTPDATLLQSIARQYSDLSSEQPSREAQRRYAQQALEYSQRAVALEPRNAVNALSVAISYGKLAIASDTRDKVRYSRLVREEAERALALDPRYAWAHHILARWHLEVAKLGGGSRAIVGLFYGGLPAASVADAVRHLERAVELEPGELQHHLELGFAYKAAGTAAKARNAFEKGLALPSRARIDDPAKARAREALTRLPQP